MVPEKRRRRAWTEREERKGRENDCKKERKWIIDTEKKEQMVQRKSSLCSPISVPEGETCVPYVLRSVSDDRIRKRGFKHQRSRSDPKSLTCLSGSCVQRGKEFWAEFEFQNTGRNREEGKKWVTHDVDFDWRGDIVESVSQNGPEKSECEWIQYVPWNPDSVSLSPSGNSTDWTCKSHLHRNIVHVLSSLHRFSTGNFQVPCYCMPHNLLHTFLSASICDSISFRVPQLLLFHSPSGRSFVLTAEHWKPEGDTRVLSLWSRVTWMKGLTTFLLMSVQKAVSEANRQVTRHMHQNSNGSTARNVCVWFHAVEWK